MSTMTDATDLHVSTVDAKPVLVEWDGGDDYEEHTEPAPFWEAFGYELDDQTYTLVAEGANVAAVVIDGHPFTAYEDYAELVESPVLDEDTFDDLMAVEPYQYGADGPMMNYFYPIEETSGGQWGTSFDALGAAAKLADLPVCVVEHEGEFGLALTGGGMDLSWEICAGYVALGKLPPVHFRDLPAYSGGWNERNETVYAAMLRSLDAAARWMTTGAERLTEMRTRMMGE